MLEAFDNQQYLNLETFRKNGQGVRTPVWFVREGDTLYVWTQANSGKAKRARNISRVNIAPCKVDGTLLGDWHPATVRRDDSLEAVKKVRGLFAKKYGLMFYAFALMGKLRKAQYTTLEITLQ